MRFTVYDFDFDDDDAPGFVPDSERLERLEDHIEALWSITTNLGQTQHALFGVVGKVAEIILPKCWTLDEALGLTPGETFARLMVQLDVLLERVGAATAEADR